jgi:plasmid stabilization system protein ParE
MNSEPEFSIGLRQLNVGHYAVFYVIEKSDVVVVRVLYGASDIGRRLLE